MKTVTGKHAFILLPDETAVSECRRLAAELLPEDAEFVNTDAHIILFSADLDEAPVELIETLLAAMKPFEGSEFSLDTIDLLEETYLTHKAVENEWLPLVHKLALAIADFVSSRAKERAVEAGKELVAAQQKNIELFAEAKALDFYEPFITLGHASSFKEFRPISVPVKASVKAFKLVTLGEYGSIKEVVL